MTVKEMLEQAYVEGWRKACEMYATWNNGEQLVGFGRRLAEVKRESAETAKPYFDAWLERARERGDNETL